LIVKAVDSKVNEEEDLDVQDNSLMAEGEEQAEELNEGLDLTTEELVGLASEVVSLLRCRKYDEATRREFAERYKFVATTALKLIGFDKALQRVPIKMLPPEQTLLLGVAILVGLGFLLPVGAQEKPLKMETNIPKSEGESSKESKNEESKGNVESSQVNEVMDVLQKLKQS